MAGIDDLLSQIPIDQLASRLGVDEQTAERAARAAVPVLIGGMEANAQDPAAAASLADAVSHHDGSLLDGGVDLDRVDAEDGAKIVRNVFGDKQDQVVNTLGGLGKGGGGGGIDAGMIAKVLPVLAPVVMAFLAKSFGGAKGSAQGGAGGAGGGGISDVLGGLLGGGGGGGGGLSDVLGGLLGGGSGGGGGGAGGIGDILGGLLGGGKR